MSKIRGKNPINTKTRIAARAIQWNSEWWVRFQYNEKDFTDIHCNSRAHADAVRDAFNLHPSMVDEEPSWLDRKHQLEKEESL